MAVSATTALTIVESNVEPRVEQTINTVGEIKTKIEVRKLDSGVTSGDEVGTKNLTPALRSGQQSPKDNVSQRSQNGSRLNKYINHNQINLDNQQIEPVLSPSPTRQGSALIQKVDTANQQFESASGDVEIANKHANNAQMTFASQQSSIVQKQTLKALSLVELDAVPLAPDGVVLGGAFTVTTESAEKSVQSPLSPEHLQVLKGQNQDQPSVMEAQDKTAHGIKTGEQKLVSDHSQLSQPEASRLRHGLLNPKLNADSALQNQMHVQMQGGYQSRNQSPDFNILMSQLNPAYKQQLLSPPGEVLLNTETHKLLELYQLQTQELMRMAGSGMNTGHGHNFQSLSTMEQAQQIAMPEIPGLQDLYDVTMRLPSSECQILPPTKHHSSNIGNIGKNGSNIQTKGNWPPIGTHPMLRLDQQSETKPNGFMDFSGFSNRTISAPDIERLNMMDPSQSNQDVSYQKITTPAFYINQHNTSSISPSDQILAPRKRDPRHMNIKEKGQAMILGMVDSEDTFKPKKSMAQQKQSPSQHYKLVKMPQPQQPRIIERNHIGGGMTIAQNKYGSAKMSDRKHKSRNNNISESCPANQRELKAQPTFPAFFQKTIKSFQMSGNMKEVDRSHGKIDQLQINNQMRAEQQMRSKTWIKGNEGRQTQRDFMKKSGKLVDPTTLANKRMSVDNSHSPRPNGTNTTAQMVHNQTEDQSGGVTVGTILPQFPQQKQGRPILMQSSVLAPSVDDQRSSVPFDIQSVNSPIIPNAVACAAFTKTSYLNKPVFLQTSSSFMPSETTQLQVTSPHRVSVYASTQAQLEQVKTSSGCATQKNKGSISITQDSKLSFKDYIEMNQAQVKDAAEKGLEQSVAGQPKDSQLDSIEGSISLASGSRNPGENRIEARHSSIQSTLVPKLQALKPKKLLDQSRGNFKSPSVQHESGHRFRRMTVMETPQRLAAHEQYVAQKISLQPLDVPNPVSHFPNYDPKSQTPYSGARFQTTRGAKSSNSGVGINAGGRMRQAAKSKDHKLEVKVMKDNVGASHLDAIAEGNATTSYSTMHIGGKFNVNVAKRTSVNSIDQSQTVNAVELNSQNQNTATQINRNSAMSTKQPSYNNVPSIITPKYFATIQAVPNKNAMKNDDMMRNDELNNTLVLLSSTEDPLFDPKAEFPNSDDRGQQAISALTQPQRNISKDLQQITPELATQDEMKMVSNYKTSTAVNAPQGALQQTENEPQLASEHDQHSHRPWHIKKNKRNQRQPVLMAEKIVQKKISPYERTRRFGNDDDQYDDSPMIIGIPKQLNMMSSKLNYATKAASQQTGAINRQSFLPELKQQKLGQTNNQQAGRGVVKQVVNQKNITAPHIVQEMSDAQTALINDTGVTTTSRAEEVDSIMDPAYLKIMANTTNSDNLNLNRNHVGIDATELSSLPIESPRQERRQVIKILDQSRWRKSDLLEQNDNESNRYMPQNNAPQTASQDGIKVQTASTMEKKVDPSSVTALHEHATDKDKDEKYDQERPVSRHKTMEHNEGSVRLDSVFDHEIDPEIYKPAGKQKNENSGRRSHMNYNADLMIDGVAKSSMLKRSSQAMLDQICESEREMKELMARELLMQDDGSGPLETSHFDQNVRFTGPPGGLQANVTQTSITDETSHHHLMNHTEYSQFIKNQDIPSTKQDFNCQFLAQDQYSHMNLTMSNLMKPSATQVANSPQRPSPYFEKTMQNNSNLSNLSVGKRFVHHKQDQFSPVNQQTIRLQLKKKSSIYLNQPEEKKQMYPVAYHSKVKPIQIDKLKNQYLTTRHFNMQRKHDLNQTFLNSPPAGAPGYKPVLNHNSVLDPSQLEQSSNLSLTRTRFSQHHRALSELRSFQQLQQTMNHQSPDHSQSPRRGNQRNSKQSRNISPKAVSPRLATLNTQPPKDSTHKLKVIKQREAKIAELRMKERMQNGELPPSRKIRHTSKGEKKQSILPVALEETTIENQTNINSSMRNLSTCMDKHAPSLMEELVSTMAGATAQNVTGQQVFVNTSGSNTKYLASPASPQSPGSPAANNQCMLVRNLPPYALQQTRTFEPVIITKSVLPSGKTYQNHQIVSKGQNKDIIDADLLTQIGEHRQHENERAASSIIANYQIQSVAEEGDHSPKSYKMPANFMHGLDSQNDSIAVPESASGVTQLAQRPDGAGKQHRMPVHSFTTPQAQKTHSSQIDSRRRMMVDKTNINGIKGIDQLISDQMCNESIEMVHTVRMYQKTDDQIVAGSGGIYHEDIKSCEDQMPERYAHDVANSEEVEGEHLATETDMIIGAAENVQSQSLESNEVKQEVIVTHIDTIRNSLQQTDSEHLKSEKHTADPEIGQRSERISPKQKNPMDAMLEPEQVMSSAQTLEAADQQISEQLQQPVKQR